MDIFVERNQQRADKVEKTYNIKEFNLLRKAFRVKLSVYIC